MNETNYGNIVSEFSAYKTDRSSAEWRLGYRRVLEVLADANGQTILDFGCGPANFSRVLSEAGARVIGFDADREVIRHAKMVDPIGDYRLNRGLLADEVKGRKIDAIIATFSFCTVPDWELRYIIRDMREVLSEEGKLIILEPNLEKSLGVKYSSLHYHRKDNVKPGDYVDVTLGAGDSAVQIPPNIYRTHDDYENLLKEAGFFIEELVEPVPGDDDDSEPDDKKEGTLERDFPPLLLIVATAH